MQIFNIHEAKTQLSKLLEAVENGQEIIIARSGKPTARLLPMESKAIERRPGALKGRMCIADDFDAPLPPDLLTAFEGG